MKRRKRALITGGAGFIGSHLSDRLVGEGYDVICMDNLLTGTKQNIRHLLGSRNFRFVFHNVTEHIDVKGPLDYVLHFASPASPVDYMKYPIQTLKVGALGTHNALGVAKAKGSTFLLASTSEVYGDPLVNPQPEDYWGNVNPLGPRGVYDEAKRFAEAITMAYFRVHHVDVKIARIFNTYGPRMREEDGRAIPNFIAQALRGDPLTVYGRGRQTRSFCFIAELVEGLFRLMRSGAHEPVNIGNPGEMTLLELARLVIRLANSESTISFTTLPVDDPKVRCPDIGKARAILGWRPKVGTEEGLRRTIEAFAQAKRARR